MPSFEMTFELPSITEDLEDDIVDTLDATMAEHFGVMTATVLIDAPACVPAASHALREFERLGVTPVRLVDDLVSRAQIADRAGVTRQAVTNWVTGARQQEVSFPKPFALSGGGLWLWSEVLPALKDMRIDIDDDAEYPSRRDSQIIGGMIATRARGRQLAAEQLAEHSSLHAYVEAKLKSVPFSERHTEQRVPVAAPTHAPLGFELAA